jgi:UDP-N-acetylmuramate--alanine ligase
MSAAHPAHARFRRVHLIGIGGAGMSAIAEVLLSQGFAVTGSDASAGASVERLRALGAKIARGHAAEQLGDAQVVVVSTAIQADNPELKAARERRIPVIPRAEMLGELMRFKRGIAVAGTHGKTTTTSLVASLLVEGGLDPTFVIGGLVHAWGSNARVGKSDWLVAEADESDGSFLLLSPVLAIVTNIDADHLSHYGGDLSALKQAFHDFLHRLPFYGLAVVCADDPGTRALIDAAPRSLLSYGLSADADIRASNVRQHETQMAFDVHLPGRPAPLSVELNLAGLHNVRNALAAVAIAVELGVDDEAIARGLQQFAGVGRRFNIRSRQFAARDALLIDDYGHHPTELKAVIDAVRGGWPTRRLVLAFQPHRFSRTRDCFEEFAQVLSEVDQLFLSEVYAAGEAPIAGADSRALARAVRARGTLDPIWVPRADELKRVLPAQVSDGDVVLLMGAGDIGQVANELAPLEAAA